MMASKQTFEDLEHMREDNDYMMYKVDILMVAVAQSIV
jgi:hypothetical protein